MPNKNLEDDLHFLAFLDISTEAVQSLLQTSGPARRQDIAAVTLAGTQSLHLQNIVRLSLDDLPVDNSWTKESGRTLAGGRAMKSPGKVRQDQSGLLLEARNSDRPAARRHTNAR